MTGGAPLRLPRPPTAAERAVLSHPDRRSPWMVLLAATLREPLSIAVLADRLAALPADVPLAGARWDGRHWVPGPAPAAQPAGVGFAGLTARLDLRREPPLRVAVDDDRRRLLVAGHHAAFDGLGLADVVGLLSGAPLGVPDRAERAPGAGRPPTRSPLARLLRPAAAARPPAAGHGGDAFAAVDLLAAAGRVGESFTARLAAASVAAIVPRLDDVRRPVGVSIALGGGVGGNQASYRRIDVAAGGSVAAAVDAALAGADVPAELVRPGRWMALLRPIVGRLSDTVLVSNLGVLDLPAVTRLEFYPVARGRSAVAVGAATVAGGASVLTVRARDWPDPATVALAADIAARLDS